MELHEELELYKKALIDFENEAEIETILNK
jgi:hypothetical protein